MAVRATPVGGGEPVVFAQVKDAIDFGFTQSGISLVLTGRYKSHKGHTFERV